MAWHGMAWQGMAHVLYVLCMYCVLYMQMRKHSTEYLIVHVIFQIQCDEFFKILRRIFYFSSFMLDINTACTPYSRYKGEGTKALSLIVIPLI